MGTGFGPLSQIERCFKEVLILVVVRALYFDVGDNHLVVSLRVIDQVAILQYLQVDQPLFLQRLLNDLKCGLLLATLFARLLVSGDRLALLALNYFKHQTGVGAAAAKQPLSQNAGVFVRLVFLNKLVGLNLFNRLNADARLLTEKQEIKGPFWEVIGGICLK